MKPRSIGFHRPPHNLDKLLSGDIGYWFDELFAQHPSYKVGVVLASVYPLKTAHGKLCSRESVELVAQRLAGVAVNGIREFS